MRRKIESLEKRFHGKLPCTCQRGNGIIEIREYAADEAPPGEPCDPGRCELCGRPRPIKFIDVVLQEGANG